MIHANVEHAGFSNNPNGVNAAQAQGARIVFRSYTYFNAIFQKKGGASAVSPQTLAA